MHTHNRITERCHYDAANFLQNAHKRHPIARPLGQSKGCLFVGQNSDVYSALVTEDMYEI